MTACYILNPGAPRSLQSPADNSFVGGIPKLPSSESIPVCRFCGSQQTFFSQVAFPRDNPWAGLSLSVFACTSCADENYLIPEMISGPRRNAHIPAGFLESYQRNFRFLVFDSNSATPQTNYRERVKFNRLQLIKATDAKSEDNKIGGSPNWVLEDEAPESYCSKAPMFFLLQILPGFRFPITAEAPPQIELGLDGSPQASPLQDHQLFIGNALFLFGTGDRQKPLVYAITQV